MILNHLWTILEIDSSKTEKGLERTEKKTDDLVKEFQNVEKQGNKSLGGLTSIAVKLAGALAASQVIAKSISGAIGLAGRVDDLNDLAQNLDINVSKLDAFSKAMYATGGSVEGAFGDIQTLTQRLGKGFKDAEGPIADTLNTLGIKLTDSKGNAKDAIDIITELSGSLESMNRPQAFAALKQLGISDPKVIENILRGRKELEALFDVEKARGVIGEKEVERAGKLTDAQDRLRAGVSRLTDSFLSKIIPALGKVIDWLGKVADWSGKHQDVITGLFIAIGGVITAVYLPIMARAAIATLAATWPMLLLVAAAAAVGVAFAIAYEDIKAFSEGNSSLIGDILGKYPAIKALVLDMINLFSKLGEGLKNLFLSVWDSIFSVFEWILNGVKKVISAVSTIPLVKTLTNSFSSGVKNSGVVEGMIPNTVLDSASSNPFNAKTSNAISNSSANSNTNNVNVGQVVVETKATDAKGISAGIKGELADQLRNVQAENKSAVTR